LILLVLLTTACASFRISDTQPLPRADLEPAGAPRISHGGYRLDSLPPSDAPDLLVLVAISGGGKRSAAFGFGALKGMREIMVPTRVGPRPLLQELSAIAGVSGGSFPATYYGLYRDAAFGRFEKDFLYQDTNSYIYGVYLLPWNWTWLVDPTVGTNDFMDRVYDRTMFHGARFRDLRERGRPLIAIGATDLSFGTPFLFTQELFDLICSDLDQFPISRAVAASNGFPGLFSPITMTNHAAECGGRQPGWLRRMSPAERLDPLSRRGVEAKMADRYLDSGQTRYVHLVDGGVSDNLALRAGGSLMETADAQAIGLRGLSNIRRILVISLDGQGTQDSSIARRRMVGGLFRLLGLVTGGQIDRYNFETFIAVGQQIQLFARAISQARCAQVPPIDGADCNDVRGQLIHISLAEMPDSPQKAQLLGIPTGLTIERGAVDRLIQAGHDAITGSASLRDFIAGYATSSPTAKPVAVGQ
jgi:NTE family protein